MEILDKSKTAGVSVGLSAILFFCTVRCYTQEIKIQYLPLGRDVIEQRLKLASNNDGEREHILEKLFQEAGCTGEHLTEQPLNGHRVPNLICTQAGTGDGIIIVGGHMDHIAEGQGVVDDWSGAALLPSLFQSLRNQPRKHAFVFIGFTEEESGLIGSHFYVHQLAKEQLTKIRAMVNLECLGLTPAKVWGDHANHALLNMYGNVAQSFHMPLMSVNVEQVGDDDADSFRNRKVPTITIHSVTQETLSVLHSYRDKLSAINVDDYYDTYRLIVAYLAYLDEALG